MYMQFGVEKGSIAGVVINADSASGSFPSKISVTVLHGWYGNIDEFIAESEEPVRHIKVKGMRGESDMNKAVLFRKDEDELRLKFVPVKCKSGEDLAVRIYLHEADALEGMVGRVTILGYINHDKVY